MKDAARLAAAPRDRLASLLAPQLRAVLFAQLFEGPRFRDRLLYLAARRLGDIPDVQPSVRRLLTLSGNDLLLLTHRIGAVWYGAALAQVIDGDSRRRLIERLGAETLRLAIDGRLVAPAEILASWDVDALADAIPPAGAAVFAAWIAVQPQAIASRLDLLRPTAEPDTTHHARGPAVVNWVLENSC